MATTTCPELRLTSSHLGDLFTIPEDDWTAISKRVGMTLLAKDIAHTIAQYLPTFPELLTACQQWKVNTFPDVVTQSYHLGTYAGTAIQEFTRLRGELAGLEPDDPLPAEARAVAEATLGELATSTRQLTTGFGQLTSQVRAFTTANDLVDAQIDAYARRLGPDWTSIRPQTEAVGNAVGRVMGAWQALDDDLANIASGHFNLTTPFLLDLQIDVALRSWDGLEQEAKAFASLAKGQQKYLDGQGLASPAPNLTGDPRRRP